MAEILAAMAPIAINILIPGRSVELKFFKVKNSRKVASKINPKCI